MSIQDLAKFYQKVESDRDLREKLISVDGAHFPETAVELGATLGLRFTVEEVRDLTDENYSRDDVWLTDDELSRMGPGPHPCNPSGVGALSLMAMSLNLRGSGKK